MFVCVQIFLCAFIRIGFGSFVTRFKSKKRYRTSRQKSNQKVPNKWLNLKLKPIERKNNNCRMSDLILRFLCVVYENRINNFIILTTINKIKRNTQVNKENKNESTLAKARTRIRYHTIAQSHVPRQMDITIIELNRKGNNQQKQIPMLIT